MRSRSAVSIGLTVLLIASLVVAVGIGAVSIAPMTALRIVWHVFFPASLTPDWSPSDEAIIWQLRLPRVLLGAITGAGLAVVGASLQAATRNPLADPYLFGISAGAALGAVTVLLHTGAFLGPLTLPIAAFAGALLSVGLVTGVAGSQRRLSPDRLILSGVAVSFVLMAATNFLIFQGDRQGAASIIFWMLGSLGHARWGNLAIPAIVLAGGLFYLIAQARRIDALILGDESALTLGIDVAKFRLRLFLVAAVVTGTLVAVSGAIGFVGLMIPHILRLFVGSNNRTLLPACALGGAVFLVWIDVCARTVMAPEDLPIGIFTAAIGGAFFLWQMRRRRV